MPETPLDTFLKANVIKRSAKFEEVQESVKEHTEKAKKKEQAANEKKCHFVELFNGDKVLNFTAQRAATKSKRNLSKLYTSPYIITELTLSFKHT